MLFYCSSNTCVLVVGSLTSAILLADENRFKGMLQGWGRREIPGSGESKCASGDLAPGAVSNRQAVNLKIAPIIQATTMPTIYFYSECGCRLAYRRMRS